MIKNEISMETISKKISIANSYMSFNNRTRFIGVELGE